MIYNDLISNHFRDFLKERPAIALNKLARKLDFDKTNLQKIIVGLRHIPKKRRGDFMRIMEKYGYHFEDNSQKLD